MLRNKILADIVAALGGTVTNASNRNQLLRDWLDAVVSEEYGIPYATNVVITGLAEVGETLVGSYTYNSTSGEAESTSTFKWLRNGAYIAGETSSTYTVTIDDIGSVLQFEVTPVGVENAGIPVKSFITDEVPTTAITSYMIASQLAGQNGAELTTAWSVDSGLTNDFSFKFDVKISPNATGYVYAFTTAGQASYMRYYANTDVWSVRINWTAISSPAIALNDGEWHTVELKVNETTIEWWYDGVLESSVASTISGKTVAFEDICMGQYDPVTDDYTLLMRNVYLTDNTTPSNSRNWPFTDNLTPTYESVTDTTDDNVTNINWYTIVEEPVVPIVLPEISSISYTGSLESDTVVTISGTNLLTEGATVPTRSVPLLWDRTSEVLEKDVLDTHYASFEQGQEVQRPNLDGGEADLETIWEKPSVNTGVYESVYGIEDTDTNWIADHFVRINHGLRPVRHDEITSHYYGIGPHNYVGWPTVYGGIETPVPSGEEGSDQIYVSWWFKPKYHPACYFTINVVDLVGTFEQGDAIAYTNTNTHITGTVIDFDGDVIMLELATSTGDLADITTIASAASIGQTIEKSGGGASCTLGSYYLNAGANKFCRLWDDDVGDHGRNSWTNATNMVNSNYSNHEWDGIAGDWNHMEIYIDKGAFRSKTYINGKLDHDLIIDPEIMANPFSDEFSFSIGLLGFDGKHQRYQECEYSEIYFDNKLNRVVVAENSTWSDVLENGGHTEVQYINNITATEVSFKAYRGSFDTLVGKYLYIFDERGICNETGYLLS